jgi:hypothetical protein
MSGKRDRITVILNFGKRRGKFTDSISGFFLTPREFLNNSLNSWLLGYQEGSGKYKKGKNILTCTKEAINTDLSIQ